jgi:hypothetical protein
MSIAELGCVKGALREFNCQASEAIILRDGPDRNKISIVVINGLSGDRK